MIIDRKVSASVPAGGTYTLIELPAPPTGYLARVGIVLSDATATGSFTIFCDQDRTSVSPAPKLSDAVYKLFADLNITAGQGSLTASAALATPVSIPYVLPTEHRIGDSTYLVLAIKHNKLVTLTATVAYCIVEASSAL